MLFIGKISQMNTSDGRLNLLVVDKNDTTINLKIKADSGVVLGRVYAFEYEVIQGQERNTFNVLSYKEVDELPLSLMD